ncbi:MAG: hypothetical protein VB053_02540 [Oscillibacter ruminantium]|uniref:hypothetical protein n=1 Tax=Oscillibacter ruminantium TaxID=1263547 RepID=UPI002B2025CF|nr:hypothetical protein [Oscillibacter ruminantium]MEA5041398.1 hypothetical protein [Oscillibacter ruminantium]
MKLLENMTLSELGVEKKIQLRRIDAAQAALEKIHGQKNYQDEVAKYFVGGMVGFRKDRKKVNRSINQYTNNAVKACEHYEAIEEAKGRIHAIDRAVNFIAENKKLGATVREIKGREREIAVESAKTVKWEKVSGHYGTAYRHGDFIVERVDTGFVAVRDIKGNLLSHFKTVKEAKAAVSLAIAKS